MSNISDLIVVGNVTKKNCDLALTLNRSPLIMSVALVSVLLVVCALYAIYKYFKAKPIRKAIGLASWNLKIIGFCGFLYYFLGLVTSFLIYSYKLYLYFRHLEGCQYIWNADFCFVSYSQFSTCSIASTLFHITLLIERSISTISTRHSRVPVFGVSAGLFIVVFPQWWVFKREYPFYRESGRLFDRSYCGGQVFNTAENNGPVINSFIDFLIVDIIITFADFCLLLYNKRLVAKYYQRISDNYTLNRSFSLKEAQLSIRLIFPFSLIQSVLFAETTLCYFYYLLYGLTSNVEMDQFWRECINLVRIFNNVILFSSLCFLHRKDPTNSIEEIRNENETDRYFQMFNQMIA
ncbi:hypothetical protein M3Y96_00552100 [Aphelenchoides besseyi]|nr:hypothetical protein M3Y96_00552100 [Aphelenchoides besseyi]